MLDIQQESSLSSVNLGNRDKSFVARSANHRLMSTRIAYRDSACPCQWVAQRNHMTRTNGDGTHQLEIAPLGRSNRLPKARA